MTATPVRINYGSVMLLPNRPAAFQRSTGVSAGTMILNPVVITCAMGILNFLVLRSEATSQSSTYLLSDKVAQLSKYVVGDSDGPGIGLEAVLCLNHRNKLGRYICVGFFQCPTMKGAGTAGHRLGRYRRS